MKVNRMLSSLEPLTNPPLVCPKPGCGASFFIPHEDGWQCWNCMAIIYRDLSLLLSIMNNLDNGAL